MYMHVYTIDVHVWYTHQYLYLRNPEKTTVEERVCKKSCDIQSKKIKVQSCHTPSPKIEENLHGIVQ